MPQIELSLPEFEKQVLEEAIQSPAVAMMRLSLEIDRQLRLILAVIGRLKDYTGQSPTEALELIAKSTEQSAIPSELADIVKSFWQLRNSVVHGGRSNEGIAMRAVDYGFRILRLVQAIPRPRYVVAAIETLFSDKECRRPRLDVKGVVLESFGPKEENFGKHVYPSRKEYLEGLNLSWEWNMHGPGWGETWYRDSSSGEIKLAWSESLEFIGRPLEQI